VRYPGQRDPPRAIPRSSRRVVPYHQRMAHRYGPHDETFHARRTVAVLRPHREGGEHRVPLPPALVRQAAQINDLAHFGYVRPEHTGRVPDLPFCLVCGRDETACLGVRFGDDDHLFESSRKVDAS
jgi:hypothetical protein